MKFQLGRLMVTRGVNDQIADDEDFAKFVTASLERYTNCDWGEMEEEDLLANDYALESGGERLFAAYNNDKYKIWIITEWDRSATSVLFPEEY